MQVSPLRIAFFPDSFHEVNGVAHTARQFESYARRHELPFFCLRPGARGQEMQAVTEGTVVGLDIPRGSLISFRVEKDLSFDPAFLRHKDFIEGHLREFRPDVIHVTGPSEPGILGQWLASGLNVPLGAAWHTNLHEYAARRSAKLLRILPEAQALAAEKRIESASLAACARFYRRARILFAPNPDLCRLLQETTGRPCHLMPRGVDTDLFSPERRRPAGDGGTLVLGYCGRLSVEKNVALLAQVRAALLARGIANVRFLIVGQGKEEAWLRQHLPDAEFTGVLRGEELARAYARMDIFLFPSHTDTFGNVVLEALASGVPAIVTPDGGPPSIVRDGETGFIAGDSGFADAAARLILNPALLTRMRGSARAYALTASWDSIFDGVYAAYEALLRPAARMAT